MPDAFKHMWRKSFLANIHLLLEIISDFCHLWVAKEEKFGGDVLICVDSRQASEESGGGMQCLSQFYRILHHVKVK